MSCQHGGCSAVAALTWLLARPLALLSALILIILDHSCAIPNWDANYLAMDNSPLGFFVPSSATYIISDLWVRRSKIGKMLVDLDQRGYWCAAAFSKGGNQIAQ
jgi:hypothetical protein